MKIIVSQQDKKILIEFYDGSGVDPSTSLRINKSEDFLLVLDKFLNKSRIRPIGRIGPIGPIKIKFQNTSILTERVIRAIIAGLKF